jgi:hypothetical protein
VPDPTYAELAGRSTAAAKLAATIGERHAGRMVAAAAAHLEAAWSPEALPGIDPRAIAATVLVAAMAGTTQGEINGGLLEGAARAVHDAELATLADTVRVAYQSAKAHPDNPLAALIRLAQLAGVDLAGDGPASLPDGYVASVDRQVLGHDQDDRTAYRFVAPGVLLAGEATVRVEGDRWHVEQDLDGRQLAADGADEIAALLALVAARLGFTATFTPAEQPADAEATP